MAQTTHRRKSEIEQLLAQRFPRPDVPATVRPIAPLQNPQLAPRQVCAQMPELVSALSSQLAPGQVGALAPLSKVAPLSPKRFVVQFTTGKEGYDDLSANPDRPDAVSY